MNLDPTLVDTLKTRTARAIEKAREEEEQRLARIKLEEERKRKAAELKAEGIINHIPSRCAKEAGVGRTHAIAMSLKYGKDHDKINGKLEYTDLKGAGALVWNACQKAGLKPTLEFWHDGMGMESGYNIVVHWDEK